MCYCQLHIYINEEIKRRDSRKLTLKYMYKLTDNVPWNYITTDPFYFCHSL